MSANADYVTKVKELWSRVQNNEEAMAEKKEILVECDKLLQDADFKANVFLATKLALIMHKAGRFTNLETLAHEFEAEAKQDPANPDIWICIAETYLHDAKPDLAIPSLEYAVTLGDNPDVLNLLSLSLRRKSPPDTAKAMEFAKKALRLNMGNGKSWANLACAYLALGGLDNIRASSKAFKMAIKNGEGTNADVLLNLGTVSELLLDFTEAMRLYTESMKITHGWALASSNLGRVKKTVQNAIVRAEAIEEMRKKKKDEFLSKLKGSKDFIVVEIPCEASDPSQILLCLGHDGKAVAIGVTQTLRAYIRCEKTVLTIGTPKFTNLEVEGKSIPYHIIEDPKDIQMVGGANPTDVPPVSISSSLA